MTQKQILKKCEIARKCGEAKLPGGDTILYFEDTKEFSLRSAYRQQTICVTYKPERIADICAE